MNKQDEGESMTNYEDGTCSKHGRSYAEYWECSPCHEDKDTRIKLLEVELRKAVEALKKANRELNAIRARDGVPYCYDGIKSDVDPNYFSSVVDEAFATVASAQAVLGEGK